MHTDKPVNIKAQCCISHLVFTSNFLYFPQKLVLVPESYKVESIPIVFCQVKQ